MIPQEVINKCTTLRDAWNTRKKKFEEWYDIILLVDELEQEGMESVVSNDPRTGYNLAKHLLTTMTIADKIPNDNLAPEYITTAAYIEQYMVNRWKAQEKRYRSIGRQSWLGEAVSWMLTSGWYSVFAMVTKDEVWSEVWSPYNCYPQYGPDGLVEHARIYTLTAAAANRKINTMNWHVNRPFTNDVIFYDYWAFDNDGDVINAIIADTQFVKPPAKDFAVSKTGRLPIFTSAVGGLPDMGSIKVNNEWQKHYGESIVATNEDLILNYNKMRSFMQQAARTAAQPHWFETSAGDTPIATEVLLNTWGSVLHGSPGEDVRPLQGSAIPIELTNILFHYQNELQRGSFPAAVFGNLQQQMSYMAMANMASAAMQVLTPYREAIVGMRTDVNNFWLEMMTKNGFKPYKFSTPIELDIIMQFDVNADLEIPGQLVQKATVARMMNPQFRLPNSWVSEKLFPEILDSLKAQADIRSEDAMMHPKAILVDQILAYKEEARKSKELGDVERAKLYDKLAQSMEAELVQPQAQAQSTQLPPEINMQGEM